MEADHVTVSDMMLVEKAKWFAEQPDVPVPDGFKFSNGWLARFKKRHGIALHKMEGEAASADVAVVTEARRELQEMLEGWDPDLVYNMDETGLFFRMEPNATLATRAVKGKKKSKERLTVALCANATGTHKIKPLVIGKSKKPRCFGAFDPSVYVTYTNNRKAWMTGAVFKDWLDDFNRQMRLKKRKALLLLDNASSHGKEWSLSNTTVKFLPPNTTAHLQPMDAGIIRTFKAYYARHRTRHYVRQADAQEKLYITVKDAITYTYDAWKTMKPEVIANCWRHTGIQGLPDSSGDADVHEDVARAIEEADAAARQLPPEMNPTSAQEQLELDGTASTEGGFSDNEIVALVTGESADPQSECDSDDDDPPPPTTLRECEAALETLMKFCGENATFGEKHVASASSMLNEIRGRRRGVSRQSNITHFFNRS